MMNHSMLALVMVLGSSAAGQGPAGVSPEPKVQEHGTKGDPYATQVARSALRERAIEALVKASVDREAVLRANAIEGLHAAPSRVEDAVRAGLSDENPGVRFVAAFTVGKLKLKKSAAFVEPLLRDNEPRVRAAAIYACSACGVAVDPTPLGGMLQNDDPLIRAEAARIVGEMGNKSAIPMLKSAAATADSRNKARFGGSMDERMVQGERVFQMQVAEALTKLGELQSADSLRAALYPSSREGFESAALAAQILGTLRDQRAVAQLVDLIEQVVPGTSETADVRQRQYLQPKEVRLAAAGALARMGHPGGMYVAEGYLNDADAAVRAQSVFVLGEGQRRSDRPSLERAMTQDGSPMVRVAAAAAILRSLSEKSR
ncbi:MAG: HEAT repeat domain-containing protein [Phycisphaerae bacterium]|nr:HEAT repeat domain-containing protein [Phycisphaerae bacterium]